MRRPVLLLVLTAFVLGGCSWGSEDPEPTASAGAQPAPTRQISLEDLGIEDWPAAEDARVPAAPRRTDLVSAEEYRRMVSTVRTWALQAATAPETVGTGLPASLKAAIDDAAQAQTAEGLARGTVLDPDLEVLDTRMTAAWQMFEEDGTVQLTLQTRTAYEVRTADGLVRVIGVLRTQGLVDTPGAPEWGTVTGWQEFGAADCAIVLDGFLTPGGDADDQESDVATFATIGNDDKPHTPRLSEEQKVDPKFEQACEAGRV